MYPATENTKGRSISIGNYCQSLADL